MRLRALATTALAAAALVTAAPGASAAPDGPDVDRLAYCVFLYDGTPEGFVRCLASAIV